MAMWRDISIRNEEAAKRLMQAGLFRSAVSRAYCAVYAAVTGRLIAAGAVQETDADNPSHKALPELVESNLAGLRTWQRRDLKSSVRRLYQLRIDADYRARARVEDVEAAQGLIEMAFALRIIRGEAAA